MRVLTTDDGYREVQNRASKWPLAGLQTERKVRGRKAVRLIDGPNEEMRRASYTDLYKSNPWVFACVQTIARSFSRLPLKVYELDEDGNRQRVRGDIPGQRGAPSGPQRLDNLLHNPNPETSGHELRVSTAIDLGIFDNALWKVGRDPATNAVSELWHIPWRKVSVVLGEDEPIIGYEVWGDRGVTDTFAPDEVVHFGRGTDPNSPLGQSPMAPLARTTGLMDAIKRHLVSFFQNHARPSGNLKLPPGTDDEMLEMMRQDVRDLYSSPEKAGEPMVTTGEWESMTTAPEHSGATDLTALSRDEVCAVLDVPPPLVGILDEAIMSNVRELREHYYRDVIGPRAKRFEDDLQAQLLPRSNSWGGLFVEFDLGEMLRPDFEAQVEAMTKARSVYTLNELRKRQNLPPIDDPRADTVWMPGAEVPLMPGTEDQHAEPGEGGDQAGAMAPQD